MPDFPQFDPPTESGEVYARGRTPDVHILGHDTVEVPGVGEMLRTITEPVAGTEHSKPLFVTERWLTGSTGFTTEGIRATYGPPLPAGVVCDVEAWPLPQVEHIDHAYLGPIVSRLHLTNAADDLETLQIGSRGTRYDDPLYPGESGPLDPATAGSGQSS